jgi:aryl-alcohol dehydrogenase-like predicted oxidoreductase
MSLLGYATPQGTDHYRQRFTGKAASEHFRRQQGLWLSSIGIGTYLGDHDAPTDRLYRQAVARAIELGCNVIDSAINYRFQRSERAIGAALKDLDAKGIAREEICVATKGGFIPFDGAPPRDIRSYLTETFVKPGIANPADVVAGCHCMAPRYLLHQLDCSLKNMDLDCVDLYYVHNPETQLAEVAREEFRRRMSRAFEALEGAVAGGKIRLYGTATWNGYRNRTRAKDYLSLAEVVGIAREVAGENHHFRAVQLPVNLAMAEALTERNQVVDGRKVSLLEAASEFGVTVMCSASILQAQLANELPPIIAEVFEGLTTDAQRAIQFVRSTPGVAVALIGMKQPDHVEENLRVAELPPVAEAQYAKLFQSADRERS